ncbi:MAG: hypothetical protein H6Q33_2062 [Deltaproteobacteria bacterium]|nr:hypothetical protein [Deltaproteobacteria bacterium]
MIQTRHHTLGQVRDELQLLPPPIVVFNKSHSGSRLLARVLASGGVFLGCRVNESADAVELLDLLHHLVLGYYPDYSRLWHARGPEDPILPDLIRDTMCRHLRGFDRASGRPWGWKLCETTYILPVIDFLFPRARYIHLIRDGRDVAFCDHVAPAESFWKKIYFNTAGITTWRGYHLTGPAYRQRSYIYNTVHWLNSVRLGRDYGAMLRERYLEVRYEDLCRDFAGAVHRVFEFCGLSAAGKTVAALQPTVHVTSIGKHRHASRWRIRRVLDIAKPELLSLGYLPPEEATP